MALMNMLQSRTKSFLVKLSLKPASSLLPSAFTLLHLLLLFVLFLPRPAEYLEEQKSSAVHLAAVPGGNTPSYSSASQAPVDNPFSPLFSALLSHSTPPKHPSAPRRPWSPSHGREVGSGVSAPERPLSLEHVGGSAAVLFRRLSFTVWDSHSSMHVSMASQVLAQSKSNFPDSHHLMYSHEKHENCLVYLDFIGTLWRLNPSQTHGQYNTKHHQTVLKVN